MIINLKKVRPLLNRGLTQTAIAKKFNVHKTTINKIVKGVIRQSRPIGAKPPIATRPIIPIWEHVDNYYPIIHRTAFQYHRYVRIQKEEVVDFLLDWVYTRREKFLKKLKRSKKPHSFLKTCLIKALFARRRELKRRKTHVVNLSDESMIRSTYLTPPLSLPSRRGSGRITSQFYF